MSVVIKFYSDSNRENQINSDWVKLLQDSDGYLSRYYKELGFPSLEEASKWWEREQADADNKRDA